MSTASVVGFTQAIVNLNSTGLIGLITTIPKLIAGVVSLTATFGASQVAALGLNGVLELLNINPVMLALSAATIAIGGIIYAQKKAAEDAQRRIDDITTKITDLTDKLSTLNGEYDSLLQKVKDGSATEAEKERLQLLNDQIEATKELIKQQTKLKYQEEFGQTTSYETDQYGGVVPVSSNSKTQTDIEKAITDAKKLSDIAGKTSDEMDKNHTDMATYISDMQSYISDLEQYEGQGLLTAQQQSDLDTMRQMVSEYGEYGDAVNVAKRALSSYVTEQEAQGNTLSEISRSNAYKLLISNLNEATNAENENSDASNNGVVALKSYSDLITELSGKFDTITSAQDELSNSGVLSYSTVQKLLEAYPDFEKHLTLTKNGFTTTKSALDGLITSQISEYQVANDNAVSAANTLINSETAKQIGYKATTASIYDQIAAMQKLAAAQLAMAGSDFVQKRLAEGDTLSEISRSQNYQDIVSSANQAYLKISGVYDNLFNSRTNLNNAKDLASSIKTADVKTPKSKKDKTEAELYVADIDKISDAEQRLKNVQGEISKQETFKNSASSSNEKIAIAQKEIGLYEQERVAIKNVNAERTKKIQDNISKLEGQGFKIAYNASSNRLIISNMEHINALKGKDNAETNKIRKAAEKLIDTTQTLNDNNIKGTEDWYSALKSIKDEYSDLQSIVSNTVEKAFDKVSDLLNEEKEAYEKQKSNLESVASTVTSYINDYISGLQEQNDELDKQISLQEKLEALDKAKTQRNKRVFKQGEGFVWTADESAVNSAQEDYDSAKREYDLDARIKQLQDYADAWENATNAYQNAIDQNLTNTILGTNWRSDALNMDYDSVYGFQRQYGDVLGELDEAVYGSVAYQIKNLEDLQKEWDDSVDEANSTGTDYQSVLDLISTYESGSYSTRLSALSDFVSSAISQYQALANAAMASTNATATVVKSTGGSGRAGSANGLLDDLLAGKTVDGLFLNQDYLDKVNGTSGGGSDDDDDWEYMDSNTLNDILSHGGSVNGLFLNQDYLDKVNGTSGGGSDDDDDWEYMDSNTLNDILSHGGSVNGLSYSQDYLDKHGYANGGVADYTGVAMLHGAQAAEMVLNNKDVSKLYDYIHSGDVLAQSAANMLVSSNLSTGSSISPSSGQPVSLSIGDIYLSGVNESSGLADAIVKRLPSQILQKFYKK